MAKKENKTKEVVIRELAVVGASLALGLVTYLVVMYIFNKIGCDCGAPFEFQGQKIYPTCGCAAQMNFARVAWPFVFILPGVSFIILNIFAFRKRG